MKKTGLIYIILAGILWGTSGIFVHYLAPFGVTSSQMTFVRALVSFLCLAVFVLIKGTDLVKTNIREILLFAGGGLSFFMTATCYYYSMQLTSISTAVVLMYTAPIFVMIYSVAFLGEKMNLLKLVAIVGMLAGCGLVSGIIGGLKFDALGIAIGFLSGIAYASYNIITKIEMKQGINPVKANFYCFLVSTVAGIVVSNPVGMIDSVKLNPPAVILLCIGVGIFASIMPYFLYTLALKEIPAGTASSLGIIEPLSATVFSVIIFGEILSLYSFMGIVLILGSVFMLSKQDK